MKENKALLIGIIIQARLSSTRLPGKILLDFYKGKCILEIICERFMTSLNYPLVVATTTDKADDVLVDFLIEKKIKYFRGNHTDVLDRFIKTAEHFGFSHIVRVCSDNPFLYSNGISELCRVLNESLFYYDYISFKIGEIPSILTHFGFWAELVSLNALYTANNSDDKIFHEHVTNYIYTNNKMFNIKWLNASKFIEENQYVRLTVDDKYDFENAQEIYEVAGENISPENIIEIVKRNPEIKEKMLLQIEKNKKY